MKTKPPLSTGEAAKKVGVAVHVLRWLVKTGKVNPVKGPRNALLWASEDIEKARALIKNRERRWAGVRF